jgi:hypothetical protein
MRTFDGVERPNFVIKEYLLRSLYDWIIYLGPPISFFDFIDFLYLWLYSLGRDRFTSLVCDLPFFSNKVIYV